MNNINLNALRDRAYKIACEHGFHNQELSNEHLLCLVISELMEAVEADRKEIRSDKFGFDKAIANAHNGEVRGEWFTYVFNRCIKDTVEDELADSVIRLLDLAGLRGIDLNLAMKDLNNNIDDMSEACKDETFTESIYAISTLPARYDGLYDFPITVNDMIMSVFGLACHLDIDLFWHIEQKMQYNELREKMHGKKY